MEDNNYEEFFFDGSGHTYYAIKYGSEDKKQKPVVLIHGLLMDPRFWFYEQVEQLRQKGDVYSISLTGHYPSQFASDFTGPIDQDFIVNMVNDQLAFFGLDQEDIILVGHSTGALAALIYAIHKPDNIVGIGVLSSEHHGIESGGIYKLFQTLNRRYGKIGYWLWCLIIKSNSISLPVHKYLLSDVAHDKKRMFSYPNFEKWIEWYFQHNSKLSAYNAGLWFRDLYKINIKSQLSAIKSPVLLLFSENDPYMNPEAMDRLKDDLLNCPDLEMKLIKDAGHLYMYESSEDFESTLFGWIERISEINGD